MSELSHKHMQLVCMLLAIATADGTGQIDTLHKQSVKLA